MFFPTPQNQGAVEALYQVWKGVVVKPSSSEISRLRIWWRVPWNRCLLEWLDSLFQWHHPWARRSKMQERHCHYAYTSKLFYTLNSILKRICVFMFLRKTRTLCKSQHVWTNFKIDSKQFAFEFNFEHDKQLIRINLKIESTTSVQVQAWLWTSFNLTWICSLPFTWSVIYNLCSSMFLHEQTFYLKLSLIEDYFWSIHYISAEVGIKSPARLFKEIRIFWELDH